MCGAQYGQAPSAAVIWMKALSADGGIQTATTMINSGAD